MELKIYEIPSQIQAALNALEVDEETGEIVGWDKLEALTESATTKIANCARFLQYAQVQIDAMKDAEEKIKARRLSAQNDYCESDDFEYLRTNAHEYPIYWSLFLWP